MNINSQIKDRVKNILPTENHRDLSDMKWTLMRSFRRHDRNASKNSWIRLRMCKLQPKNQLGVQMDMFFL